MGRVLDEIREAIEQSESSRYAISKVTGVSQAQLSRLMAGRSGLSIASLERVADYLGLEILIRPKRRKRDK
jgi:transcriptional regulator with XRE-family HTH domain